MELSKQSSQGRCKLWATPNPLVQKEWGEIGPIGAKITGQKQVPEHVGGLVQDLRANWFWLATNASHCVAFLFANFNQGLSVQSFRGKMIQEISIKNLTKYELEVEHDHLFDRGFGQRR
eukprot:scaffold29583_cov19-Tisochrysis_lutea.AAC.1